MLLDTTADLYIDTPEYISIVNLRSGISLSFIDTKGRIDALDK